MKKILPLILIIGLVVGVALVALSRDWQAPTVQLPAGSYVRQQVVVTVADNRGLGEVCTILDGNSAEASCVDADRAVAFELTVDLTPLADGEHEICVEASDANPYFANRTSQCQSYVLDTVPPRAVLESATRYMQRGGSAAVFVSTAEPETNLRLTVGDERFPFISNDAGTRHFAVFAHPDVVEVADFKPMVEIEDAAGNIRRLLIGTVTKDRSFKTDILNIPHAFIEKKALEMLNREGTDKETFLAMNSALRVENQAKIQELLAAAPAFEPVWRGEFFRNPGAPRAHFAERRTYLLDGEEIDRQTHYGIDIAGLAKMPIKAANDGTVIFTDYLGIYGNTVIVDHGGHVYTLYAHMSEMTVTPGTEVARGQELGRSGATGMAAGDHLHYDTYVAGVPVDPVEWFDPAWLQTRIDDIYSAFKAE